MFVIKSVMALVLPGILSIVWIGLLKTVIPVLNMILGIEEEEGTFSLLLFLDFKKFGSCFPRLSVSHCVLLCVIASNDEDTHPDDIHYVPSFLDKIVVCLFLVI